jgi:hypothetical protein
MDTPTERITLGGLAAAALLVGALITVREFDDRAIDAGVTTGLIFGPMLLAFGGLCVIAYLLAGALRR